MNIVYFGYFILEKMNKKDRKDKRKMLPEKTPDCMPKQRNTQVDGNNTIQCQHRNKD